MSATPRTHNSDGTRARGSSNGNDRGNVEQRRRRRAYLLETYAADVKLIKVEYEDGVTLMLEPTPTSDYRWWLTQINSLPLDDATVAVLSVEEVLTARCYRCGCLLHDGTITSTASTPRRTAARTLGIMCVPLAVRATRSPEEGCERSD